MEEKLAAMRNYFGKSSGTEINQRLQAMSKEELQTLYHKFGLLPVITYFQGKTMGEDIKGFVRYMDNYLIECSGGNRQNLIRLGEELTGQSIKGNSLRIIRSEIISHYLRKCENR